MPASPSGPRRECRCSPGRAPLAAGTACGRRYRCAAAGPGPGGAGEAGVSGSLEITWKSSRVLLRNHCLGPPLASGPADTESVKGEDSPGSGGPAQPR